MRGSVGDATVSPPSPLPFGDAAIVRQLLLKHYAEEGRGCMLDLRRRYGLVSV